jgi:hypothetical protein
MSSLFKSPPKPPPPPKVPNEDDIRKAKKKSVAKQIARSGRLSTMLSSVAEKLGN